MASNHTTNYQLNQWAKPDRVMMDDFNADNAKIDAALKANADAIAAAAAAQTNCTVVCGTYTGTGKYGSGNKNSLTFPFEPKLVIVQNKDKAMPELRASDTHQYGMLLAIRGLAQYQTSSYSFILSWEGNTLRWYSEYNERLQLNVSGQAYCYLAIG